MKTPWDCPCGGQDTRCACTRKPRKVHAGEPGYIAERRNPFAAGKVCIYVADAQGIDVAPDKYAVVCDAHGTICGTSSVVKARSLMKYPEFCEACMTFEHANAQTIVTHRNDVPLCARAMGCLCAIHAAGAPASDECDADEERARRYADEHAEEND